MRMKKKFEGFKKKLKNAKDNEEETQKVFKEIKKDNALCEGYFEIFQKVRDGESFEAGRDKNVRDKLNKEFRKTMDLYESWEEKEKSQKAVYKA